MRIRTLGLLAVSLAIPAVGLPTGTAITAAGLLDFQVVESKSFPAGSPGQFSPIQSITARDVNGDGYPEVLLTVTAYPEFTPQEPIIIDARTTLVIATREIFVNTIPTVRNSPSTVFADLDGNGLDDLLFADAGMDAPPWTGSGIGVALNVGGGKYQDISSFVPAILQTTRSYSLAAGDIDGDGKVEIIMPGGAPQNNGANTALLRWNGRGFDAQYRWISPAIWQGPMNLGGNSWMGVADMNNDGRQDLVVGGAAAHPNQRILFGSNRLRAEDVLELPDGPFGHGQLWNAGDRNLKEKQGADVIYEAVADFDNDGLLDIMALQEQVFDYKPGAITDRNYPNFDSLFANGGQAYGDIALQVFMNKGNRRFGDNSGASSQQNLGRRYYQGLKAVDMNNDGFLDVVGPYYTKRYGSDVGFAWGTTFLMNDGTGAFRVVDGAEVLPKVSSQRGLGLFMPTLVRPGRTEGVIVQPVFASGNVLSLSVYKIVANSSLAPMRLRSR